MATVANLPMGKTSFGARCHQRRNNNNSYSSNNNNFTICTTSKPLHICLTCFRNRPSKDIARIAPATKGSRVISTVLICST